MDSQQAQIAEILDELLVIVQSGTQDLDWQSEYENEEDLIEDLRDHAERIRRGDTTRLAELKYVLYPTIALNEIAFSSGWGQAYVRLANRFDELYTGPLVVRPRELARREEPASRAEAASRGELPLRDEPALCDEPASGS